MRNFLALGVAALVLSGCMDSTTAGGSGGGYNRVVTIGNATNVTMVRFYASNISRTSWENDILGASVLPAGSSVDVNIDDYSGACRFDLKAVFADGDEVIERDFNVCTQSSWTVY